MTCRCLDIMRMRLRGKSRGIKRIFLGTTLAKRPLESPKSGGQDSIRMELWWLICVREVGGTELGYIQRRALVLADSTYYNLVMLSFG